MPSLADAYPTVGFNLLQPIVAIFSPLSPERESRLTPARSGAIILQLDAITATVAQ